MRWSTLSVALVGAAIGAILVVGFGFNVHVGSEWFLTGREALVPSMLAGAIAALLIRYLLSHR
jgi:hypothetical protein